MDGEVLFHELVEKTEEEKALIKKKREEKKYVFEICPDIHFCIEHRCVQFIIQCYLFFPDFLFQLNYKCIS